MTKAESTWAPMRSRVFRALWIAVLVSNVGTYLQTVGAQLLLVNVAHAAILGALVRRRTCCPMRSLAWPAVFMRTSSIAAGS